MSGTPSPSWEEEFEDRNDTVSNTVSGRSIPWAEELTPPDPQLPPPDREELAWAELLRGACSPGPPPGEVIIIYQPLLNIRLKFRLISTDFGPLSAALFTPEMSRFQTPPTLPR